ncbi:MULTISPECIES: winged helix-turn-helix transcriptional regulator [Flavobacterium]|uniref:winged helix-turn-helix transcriptional regulator n=1 Tax=Flavobacterium TaxID=237 RepID=UPI001183849A|nr:MULTISPECIES: helix-turn-helix domain-containing protein [Flavobacterium]MCR4033892.1 helix-turn-helix transcriptional regulator [Flavobacterium panacis]
MKENDNAFGECKKQMLPIRDALDVLNGKWKLLIIVSLMLGNKRFNEIQNTVFNISPKVLAKELKELEQNKLIKRTVLDTYPVLIEYSLTAYGESLTGIMKELHEWGTNHRKVLFGK